MAKTNVLFIFCAALVIFSDSQWQVGSTPGLKIIPRPQASDVDIPLIWYQPSNSRTQQYFLKELRDFEASYGDDLKGSNVVQCELGQQPQEGKVCDVKLLDRPCTQRDGYGYNSSIGGPCIFFKLDEVYDWKPEFYYNTSNLPSKMPKELKHRIQYRENTDAVRTVWLTCEGENPADHENIGPIVYMPFPGFGGQYFPYKNIKGYLSPVVALYFEAPTRGVLINIRCKIWAKNIRHDRNEGSIQFELLVDN